MKHLLMKNRKELIKYLLGALLTAINGVMQSLALASAFGIFEATSQEEIIERIVVTAILGLSPSLIQMVSRFLRIGFMRDILIEVRKLAYQKVMKIPIEEFRQKKREDYMAMLVNDINIFEHDYFLSILNIIYSYGSFILGEIILFFVNPWIALMVLVASIVIFLVTKVFEKPIRASVKRNQEANANYNEQVSNILNGLEVIKLYQVEDKFKPPFYNIVNRLEQVKRKTNIFQTTQDRIIEWFANMFQIAMYIFATYLYIQGQIDLSAMILVFSFSGQMIWANVNGASMINRYRSSIDIFNSITSQPSWETGDNAFDFNKQIHVSHLNFAYGEKEVIKDLNFTIDKNQKVLIYGPSGTGKTTLLNCLSQNLTSYEGEINVDEHELTSINFESLLKHCGYVRQHHFLFDDSIKNNIVLDQEYDQDKLIKVLKSVDLWEWIKNLEEGVDHRLQSNGSNISGGQRQRISIARELYGDFEVLFVDEPSASLDDETAKKIYDTLFSLDKTLVIVSHRHLDYLSQEVDQVVQFLPEGGYQLEKN